jgi:hypothetical protein
MLETNYRLELVLTGFAGILAATLVGAGEFLLHYDPLVRYTQGFEFLKGVTEFQATTGHFLGVFGGPLYLLGAWHLYLMLRRANPFWAKLAFLLLAYGFIVGGVWIGSRATASFMVNTMSGDALASALGLYELRYENLLTVVRIAALGFSAIFVWLILSGRSAYPRWMAILNPILLIIASFLIFWIAPGIGKFLMPIALNVAFFIVFSVSTFIAIRSHPGESP